MTGGTSETVHSDHYTYEYTNSLYTEPPSGSGSMTEKEWYSIDIPVKAESFALNYNNGSSTTARYDIYKLSDTLSGTAPDWTDGGMYYETSSSNTLGLVYPSYKKTVDYKPNDNYASRGDDLYVVVSNQDDWKNLRIVFFDGGGAAIENSDVPAVSAITPEYLGHLAYSQYPEDGKSTDNINAVGYWFKAAIPTGAESFKVTSPLRDSDTGGIYELKNNRTYHFKKDYTPSDMQYRITDTLSGGKYGLECLYPIFTEDSYFTLADHDDINSSIPCGGEGVDESAVSSYKGNNVVMPLSTSGQNDSPVLYQTNSDNITYTWQSGTKLYFDNSSVNWTSPHVHLWGDPNGTQTSWPGLSMNDEGSNLWSIDLIGSNNGVPYDYSHSTGAKFSDNGGSATGDIDLPNTLSTQNHVLRGTASSGTVDTTKLYVQQPSGDGWNSMKAYFYKSSNGSFYSAWPGESADGWENYTVNGQVFNNCKYVTIPSGYDMVIFNNGESAAEKNIRLITYHLLRVICIRSTEEAYLRIHPEAIHIIRKAQSPQEAAV